MKLFKCKHLLKGLDGQFLQNGLASVSLINQSTARLSTEARSAKVDGIWRQFSWLLFLATLFLVFSMPFYAMAADESVMICHVPGGDECGTTKLLRNIWKVN